MVTLYPGNNLSLLPYHCVLVSAMSSKSKGVVDDAELADLSEDQLRELAEFIDPDVSQSVFVCLCTPLMVKKSWRTICPQL